MKTVTKLLAAAALVSAALTFTPAGRYARVAWHELVDWLDGQVPFAKKVKALRNDIADLDKVIEGHKREVATRAVAADRAKEAHAGSEAALAEARKLLRKAKFDIDTCSADELTAARNAFVGASLTFEKAEAAFAETGAAVARANEAHRVAKHLLRTKQEARDALAKEVDALEQRHANNQLTEAQTGRGDDEVARIKARVAELSTKLDIDKYVIESDAPRRAAQPVAGSEFHKHLKQYAGRVSE